MVINWIPLAERAPTEADAAKDNCVMWWHVYNGCMIGGYQTHQINQFYTHWAHLPEPPEDAPTVEEYWAQRKKRS